MLSAAVDLGVQVDALAALAAWLRVRTEELPCDPAVGELLEAISKEVLGGGSARPAGRTDAADVTDGTDGTGRQGAAQVGSGIDTSAAVATVGLARAFLRQAIELVDNPGRSGAWDQVDVPMLQSIGRLSMGIAGAVRVAQGVVPQLDERLTSPRPRILDVGVGTGWLAIALAHAYPTARVVGVDVFAPALDLARVNVVQEGLQDRVELRLADASDLHDEDGFDVIWLPMPFLPRALVPQVFRAAAAALRPGGVLLAGTFTGPDGPLAQLVTDLRTVRSGGHPWTPEEILGLLASHDLHDPREVPRTWPAPVRLYAGHLADRHA